MLPSLEFPGSLNTVSINFTASFGYLGWRVKGEMQKKRTGFLTVYQNYFCYMWLAVALSAVSLNAWEQFMLH